MLYRVPLRLLGDLISTKALERLIGDAARAQGSDLAQLNREQLEGILKREVFRRLQVSVPAPIAKRRIQEVLDTLTAAPAEDTAGDLEDRATLDGLEQAARRFALYFDWPESQRLRALIAVARDELEQGRRPAGLLAEGQDLVGALDRRLQEGLVAQATDLAELKADLSRFAAVGGPKVRRLDTLLRQVGDAQAQSALLPGEVERARKLALDLRKLVESSVVTRAVVGLGEDLPVEVDLELLPQDARARLRGAEREAEARDLSDLQRQYADLTELRPELQQAVVELHARFEAGEPVEQDISQLRASFTAAHASALREQREQIGALQTRFEALASGKNAELLEQTALALKVAQGTLEGGALASGALSELDGTISTLERGDSGADRLLALQRETFELERDARDLPGASAELAGPLQAAREQLARGEETDLAPLWAMLERRLNQAAHQREQLDARADAVIRDYDQYRHLAGETTLRLGRLADTLRAQRRLGALSADARASYAATLDSAEALLGEAKAEFEAAREVTAAFGSDALAGLLDVFGAGEGDWSVAEPEPQGVAPGGPLRAALDELSAQNARLWLIVDGKAHYGEPDDAAFGLARLLAQAPAADLLTQEGGGHAWLALRLDGGALVLHTRPAVLQDWRARLLSQMESLRALA